MNSSHPPDTTGPQASAMRVMIQQPALPRYRVPVFQEFARRPGIDLTVLYGDRSSSPPNVEDMPFNAQCVHLQEVSIGRHPVMWHWPQWRGGARRACDVLVLSWDVHYASLVPGLLRAKSNGVRTVLWGHGYSKCEAGWRSRVRSRIARLADALLFYNHTAAEQYLDAGFDPGRVFVGLNAMDQTPLQNARQPWLAEPQKIEAFRRENNLGDGPIVLFVSRLEPANRLGLLIDALPGLVARVPGIQCVIIGKGEPELTNLRRHADERGVAGHVRFPGPIYDENELAPWFLAADVFCYPANIGLSILHAFGYGLPVVTSDHLESQNPEIEALRDGENGLLYRDNDSASLGDTLARLIEDHGLRQCLSEEACRTATQRFTLGNMVDGMEAAIRRAADLTA